jgi:hypothetical protein
MGSSIWPRSEHANEINILFEAAIVQLLFDCFNATHDIRIIVEIFNAKHGTLTKEKENSISKLEFLSLRIDSRIIQADS